MTKAQTPISLEPPVTHASSSPAQSSNLPKLETAYGHFLLPSPSPGAPQPALLLRGVNLSSTSKLPTFKESVQTQGSTREERDRERLDEVGWRTDLPGESGWWDEAENGGRDGWFVGRPLKEEDADVSDP